MEIYNGKHCVYIHTNKINGKKYVGQTSSKPEHRWNNGNGYKTQPYFYRAIQKYGWDNFDHEIIASNLTQEEADNFEILLINELNTINRDFGYNTCTGGRTGGHIQTEETRKKMSETRKGKPLSEYHKQRISESKLGECNPMYGTKHTDEWKQMMRGKHKYGNNAFAKIVYQYSLDGELIKIWDSASRASDELGIYYEGITSCCRGYWSSGHACNEFAGSTWRYEGVPFDREKINTRTNIKTVYQFSLDGDFIKEWECASKASAALNIKQQRINACCNLNNKTKTAGGFIWSYDRNFVLIEEKKIKGKPVVQCFLNWNLIQIFENARDAERITGVNYSCISECCNNKQSHETAGGYRWRFATEEEVDKYVQNSQL